MIDEEESTINVEGNEIHLDKKENEIYHCTYRYGENEIELEYQNEIHRWRILSIESNISSFSNSNSNEFQCLKEFLIEVESIENLSFDEQIQFIIKKFDQFFSELKIDRSMKETKKISMENESFEHDEETRKSSLLKLPSNSSQRIRQDSSSSGNSIRYTSFVPSPRLSLSYRRIIQSIVLKVQFKRTSLGKFFRLFSRQPSTSELNRLGNEFLIIYNGKFNYQSGHQFLLSLENRIWILTIETIRCVQCRVGEVEPRSMLILHCGDRYHSIEH